ncbi:MAG: hypothetical protein EU542_09005 [Promethearchaeota archaeon]|nr:MAG: hypothetical protein EU542_09005 [Candidatus Lokiarchaeota archaeon]
MNTITKYSILPYQVQIKKDDQHSHQYYIPTLLFNETKYHSFIKMLKTKILQKNGELDTTLMKLSQLMSYLRRIIDEQLTQNQFKMNIKTEYLREWLIYKILGLEQLMCLLIDDNIQEIYLDKPNSPLYIDHTDYGRCLTNIILTSTDLQKFVSRLCLEKDTFINHSNPSLKAEIETRTFHIRATVDISPLAADGFSMNVRKLRRKIWTLPELIANNTLTIEAASYLLFLLKRRNNFTFIGEPGSGKTTLANAIDLLTAPQWRKISIEEVIESVDQKHFNRFQTRFLVTPFEKKSGQLTKSEEIIKLLHRSPDWVFLGEIQTAEHSNALFEALSAGLVGIQTCHGRSIELMISRWIQQHKISPICILSLDLLIQVSIGFDNWQINRRVSRIAEIANSEQEKNPINQTDTEINIIDIFQYDYHENKLVKCLDLYKTPLVNRIRSYENLSLKKFNLELEQIQKILQYLVENQIYDLSNTLRYLSSILYNKLLTEQKKECVLSK